MNALVLQPTSMAQWHKLVTDAEKLCKAGLSEEIESYLVFLLMRFINHPDLAQKVFALDYLAGLQNSDMARLQDVGDECLLYSGLFPGQAEHRRVHISYFVDIGRSAYATLALQGKQELFEELYKDFVELMDILQTMREVSQEAVGLTPLQAEELWRDTGSAHARLILRRYTAFDPLLGRHFTTHH